MVLCILLKEASISIHALREEGDGFWKNVLSDFALFLSTPSARRATGHQAVNIMIAVDFYPRPPRGGRHCRGRCGLQDGPISIHALREEGDYRMTDKTGPLAISIHALREEGDAQKI